MSIRKIPLAAFAGALFLLAPLLAGKPAEKKASSSGMQPTVVTQYVDRLVVVSSQIDEVTIRWLQDYMDGKMSLGLLQSALDNHRRSGVVRNPGTENQLYLQRVRNRTGAQ